MDTRKMSPFTKPSGEVLITYITVMLGLVRVKQSVVIVSVRGFAKRFIANGAWYANFRPWRMLRRPLDMLLI